MSELPVSVCSISLNSTDSLRLIGVPSNLVDGFREALKSSWPRGIQDEGIRKGTWEFKLYGNPWFGQGEEAVDSRRLIVAVLTFMAQNGWTLLQSADLSKKSTDKDTMFFELGERDSEPQIFSLSFNMTDRIRVIGAPAICPIVTKSVQTYWKFGIQNKCNYNGAMELKLCGNPWYSSGTDALNARILLNHVLADLRVAGFKLYGSIDISYGYKGAELESWFFRNVGSVYH